MICCKCGAEIADGSRFCPKCGTSQESPHRKENILLSKKTFVLLGSVLAVLLAVILVIILFLNPFGKNETPAVGESSTVASGTAESSAGSQAAESSAGGQAAESSTQQDESTDAAVETETTEEEEYTLLVAAPADEAHLLATPDLKDNGALYTVAAGTYLKWYGATETLQDHDFYYVNVRDGEGEGYINADECVQVDFEPDMGELKIIGIENAKYTYDWMVEDLKTLCSEYPDIIRSRVLGKSRDGRDIYEATLGNPDAENHVFAQASIHGREYINTQLVMKLLEYYAHYYDTATLNGVVYKDLFNKTCIHIVPMSNPDGVVIASQGIDQLNDEYYAELVKECYARDVYYLVHELNSRGDWNWNDHYSDETFIRTPDMEIISFDEYQKIWKANAAGVDLNRNYDVGWYDLKGHPEESFNNFNGYYPESEPETQILMKAAQEKDFRAYISYHSMGQVIYYDAAGNTAATSAASGELVDKFHSWLRYEPKNNKTAYNVTLGGFGDWVQLKLNRPSITVESGKHPCPVSADEFPGIWFRHFETWAKLAGEYY